MPDIQKHSLTMAPYVPSEVSELGRVTLTPHPYDQ